MPTEPTECSPQTVCRGAAAEEELRQPQKDVKIFRRQQNQTHAPLGYSRSYVAKTGPKRPRPQNKKPSTARSGTSTKNQQKTSRSTGTENGCPVPPYPPAPSSDEKDPVESPSSTVARPTTVSRPPSFTETQREKHLRREKRGTKTDRGVASTGREADADPDGGTYTSGGQGESSTESERLQSLDDADEEIAATGTGASCTSSRSADEIASDQAQQTRMDAAAILEHLSLQHAEMTPPSLSPLKAAISPPPSIAATSTPSPLSHTESVDGQIIGRVTRPNRTAQIKAIETAFKDGRLPKATYEEARRDLVRLEKQEKEREMDVSLVGRQWHTRASQPHEPLSLLHWL